ncbi:probable GPI-anchored adhesin-like protein PGA55 isoform X2 [Zootermopsis nevadensis]|uniref:probable GPI-anchored adhesin-like protein PGA55 isoform X2 n=1 Tax=Zootermopsis nevadensis TaxID=136037 RepID=UPI000B8E2772|nr:probable GPI-anchored adhesin-like protein PGA55 isoform X2 [Zootermopsis nevadensis]
MIRYVLSVLWDFLLIIFGLKNRTLQTHDIQAPPVVRDNYKTQASAEPEAYPYYYTQNSRDKMAELVPTGGSTVVAQEQSSSVESSSSEVTKEIGNRKIHEKSSEFQSEEVSKKVEESNRSVSSSSTRIVSSSTSSVSSSVTAQRVSSSSIGIEGSTQDNPIEAGGNKEPEAAPQVLPSDDTGPQQQVYEAEISQEFFVREEDGKVVEEHSASSQQETASCNLDAREAPQPVPERGIAGAVEREEVPTLNGSSATEIQQESIKNTLKEIISEIEEAVVSEVNSDNTVATNKITQETEGKGTEQVGAKTYDKQTSTSTLEEDINTNQQIAQELNQVLGNLNAAAPTQQNGESHAINGDSTQAQQVCEHLSAGFPVKFSFTEEACIGK